jgi:hypothetical protein
MPEQHARQTRSGEQTMWRALEGPCVSALRAVEIGCQSPTMNAAQD